MTKRIDSATGRLGREHGLGVDGERIDVPHGHVHAYVDGLAVTIDLKAKLQTPVARGPSRRIRMAPSEVTARQTYDKLTGSETKWAAWKLCRLIISSV